jgi:hypothetical protein
LLWPQKRQLCWGIGRRRRGFWAFKCTRGPVANPGAYRQTDNSALRGADYRSNGRADDESEAALKTADETNSRARGSTNYRAGYSTNALSDSSTGTYIIGRLGNDALPTTCAIGGFAGPVRIGRACGEE